ncbi:unnamed protein product [Moneuplotes crassus]|uniref:Uncharacterized protein n=1 Tax=Euplotes crassus TaxID=5936 RepID=A0AAD1X6M3_EUPCR|nr:unnamed protein product [Moneuplotes crassus]
MINLTSSLDSPPPKPSENPDMSDFTITSTMLPCGPVPVRKRPNNSKRGLKHSNSQYLAHLKKKFIRTKKGSPGKSQRRMKKDPQFIRNSRVKISDSTKQVLFCRQKSIDSKTPVKAKTRRQTRNMNKNVSINSRRRLNSEQEKRELREQCTKYFPNIKRCKSMYKSPKASIPKARNKQDQRESARNNKRKSYTPYKFNVVTKEVNLEDTLNDSKSDDIDQDDFVQKYLTKNFY